MYGYAQRVRNQTEAGGEIYSPTPYSSSLLVAIAGPHPKDSRSLYSYNPDIEAATRARNVEYERGRHAIGLWHTHPELRPSPSGRDAFQNLRLWLPLHYCVDRLITRENAPYGIRASS
ncbi:hypothetical protein DPR02_29460 [Burkholderia cepacia]|uniref:JAB domain-containing protein n=2 Tax=Burkholderia cepacia TaxID=292 RepID=A0AAQ0JGX9_BURCE|nr:hypothetical protein DPR02_29460 [Burkholderia cepacia]